jgi:hypothetical protein
MELGFLDICVFPAFFGGDKGAAGALVKSDSVDALKSAVDATHPRKCPEYKDKYAVHTCKVVDGVRVYDGLLG